MDQDMNQDIIHIIAANCYAKPCTLRRHIATKLLAEPRLQVTHRVMSRPYAVGDNPLSRENYDGWDAHERRVYKDLGQYTCRARHLSRVFNTALLIAERNWLKEMALDFRLFRQLCFRSREYTAKDTLKHDEIIELFPEADFVLPPRELSDCGVVNDPLSEQDRMQLARRRRQAFGAPRPYREVDEQVCSGVIQLWSILFRNLPKNIKSLRVIAKNNFPCSSFRWENLQHTDKDEMWRILIEDLKDVFLDLVPGWSTDWQ